VHIQFRQKEHEIVREESKTSETVTVPRWTERNDRSDTRLKKDNSKSTFKENSSVEDIEDKFRELRTDGITRNTHHTWDPADVASQEPTFIELESRLQTALVCKYENDTPFEEMHKEHTYKINGDDQAKPEQNPNLKISPSNPPNDEITYTDNVFRSDTKEIGDVQYIVHNLSKENTGESVLKTIEDAQDLAFTAHLNSI